MIWILLACGSGTPFFWESPYDVEERGPFRVESYGRSGAVHNSGSSFSVVYVDGKRLDIPRGVIHEAGISDDPAWQAIAMNVFYQKRTSTWILKLQDGKELWTSMCGRSSAMGDWRGQYFLSVECESIYDASDQRVYANPYPPRYPKELKVSTTEWYAWIKAQGPVGTPANLPPWARP